MRKSYKMPSKQELECAYMELKSMKAVGDKYGCCNGTVYNWMKFYGIKSIPTKGRKLPEDVRLKVIKSLKYGGMKGRHHSKETKEKMSNERKGCKNHNYKGGKTNYMRKIRRTKEYIHWRNSVIERAGGKCEMCGRELPLEAHHVISIHKDISGIYDINNGRALCNDCHLIADGKEKRKNV